MPEPIVIATFKDYLVHGYRLEAWCPECRRRAECNLAEYVMRGWGDREPSTNRPRCRGCASVGRWLILPPAPEVGDRRTRYGASGAAPTTGDP